MPPTPFTRLVVVVVAALALVVACSSGPPSLIGATCSTDQDCSSLTVGNQTGQCTGSMFCTHPCSFNTDCGCATGTSATTLAAGDCSVACILPDKSDYSTTNPQGQGWICERLCKLDSDCGGASKCIGVVNGSFAPANFSVCNPPNDAQPIIAPYLQHS